MLALPMRILIVLVVVLTVNPIFWEKALALDTLPQPSYVGAGPSRMTLPSYERIPINTVLAHPDRYQMRNIRLRGTVTAIQTEIITNRMICGVAHEKTTLTLEDDSGQVELVERGACGQNLSRLKAPMLQVGQQIDLLVLINIPTALGTASSSVEATIRYIDLVR